MFAFIYKWKLNRLAKKQLALSQKLNDMKTNEGIIDMSSEDFKELREVTLKIEELAYHQAQRRIANLENSTIKFLNGQLIVELPTNTAGLSPGTLWNNDGKLSIVEKL